MGSQSRRFRASKIVDLELFNLGWLLLLCLGFLIRPAADHHGNMFRYANSGAYSGEQRRSEVITVANPGAFSLKLVTTSEVIAIANSASTNINTTSSNIFDGRCIVCGNSSSETDYGNTFQYADLGALLFLEQKDSEVVNVANNAVLNNYDGRCSLIGIELFGDLNSSQSYNHDFTRSKIHDGFAPYKSHSIVPRDVALSENSSRGKVSLLMSIAIVFGSVSGTFRHFPGSETEGAGLPECDPPNVSLTTGIDLGPSFFIIHLVISLLVTIIIMEWKRLRDVILFKPNNEESDLDESCLADEILYKNLLKEAVLIGSKGSSGKVFKVRFLELDCAMKVFHSYARMDFRKESITLRNLSHPHIVKFFCCFRKSFIIMELMDEDLFSFITKIREKHIDMPLEVALDIMLQIAKGMSYLHNQGIAYLDLKSLNILLKLQGELDDPDFQIIAKVSDFGSARRFNPRYPKGFVLVPNMNIGTRLWRAPELFRPWGGFLTSFFGLNPRVLPKPLDIYGFAVICSELLTKQTPFSNHKDLRILPYVRSFMRYAHS